MAHRSLCSQSVALLALCALAAQARPVSPLIGQWTEARVGLPTTTNYRPDGVYTVTLPVQPPFVIRGRYIIRGNTLICTGTAMASGGKAIAWPPKPDDGVTRYSRIDKYRFSITGGSLLLTSADGFKETYTKVASTSIVRKPQRSRRHDEHL